jgi:FixJ family two-component response regulator
MTKPSAFVFVIDDDPSIRRAIHRLLESVGLEVGLFESTGNFFEALAPMFRAA